MLPSAIIRHEPTIFSLYLCADNMNSIFGAISEFIAKNRKIPYFKDLWHVLPILNLILFKLQACLPLSTMKAAVAKVIPITHSANAGKSLRPKHTSNFIQKNLNCLFTLTMWAIGCPQFEGWVFHLSLDMRLILSSAWCQCPSATLGSGQMNPSKGNVNKNYPDPS